MKFGKTMSKLGRKPIEINSEIEAQLKDGVLFFKGKKGSFELRVLPFIKVELKDNKITLGVTEDNRQSRANLGTMAALTKNALSGVAQGFEKKLLLEGIGFRASMEGKNLVLNVGFSHPVKFTPPEAISIVVEKNVVKVSGIDKFLVGEVAAQIRRIKKPEPYKGKGIRYEGEIIRKKAGKKAVGATT